MSTLRIGSNTEDGSSATTILPGNDRATAAWWAAAEVGRLLVQTCGRCRTRQHPPGPVCRDCGATETLTLTDHDCRGRLVSVTTVAQSNYPAYCDLVPYQLALVDLDPQPAAQEPGAGAYSLALMADPIDGPPASLGTPGRLGFKQVGGHPVLTFTVDLPGGQPATANLVRECAR